MSSISAIAFDVWSARLPISVATTANPLPASPALAASIDALSANRLVCDEISIIVPVSSFILSTALDPSIASVAFSFTLVYICIVLLLAVTVFSCKAVALCITSSEFFAPFSAIVLMFSASSLILLTFSLIVTVVAAVSSMPAASCWLVAELSEHIWFTVSVMLLSPVTFVFIRSPAFFISATMSLKFLRMLRTSLAITPVSSFLAHNLALAGLCSKLSCDVLLIISVRSFIGRVINLLSI